MPPPVRSPQWLFTMSPSMSSSRTHLPKSGVVPPEVVYSTPLRRGFTGTESDARTPAACISRMPMNCKNEAFGFRLKPPLPAHRSSFGIETRSGLKV